jgi:hypothetical protein
MKTQKTPQEKFKAGLKKSGYDPDAGAKRLLDLIAKQKKEREEFESKYKSAYEGREMKTLKQIVEGTVVMTDFKLDKKGKRYKAHRTTMGRDVRMNEEGEYPHVGTGRSKDMQMARDIATMNAKTSLLRSIHGDGNFQDKPMPEYEEDKLDLKPDEKGGYTATVKMRQKATPAVKEDTEQVDEISYGTLRSYVDKAKAENLPGKGGNRGVALLTPGTRDKGVHKAVDRMRKMKTNEANDPREYDYEGDMAKSQLRSIIANAKQVHDMLKDDTNMAEWVQSKITLSADYISTVADYMQSEVNEEFEQVDEGATRVEQQSGSDRAYDVIHKDTGKTVGVVYTPGKTNPKHVASVNGSDGRPFKSGEFDSFRDAHNFIKKSRNIDEARGRPAGAATLAKRAAAAAKPREDDDEGEHYDADSGVEADQHIHVQLKKASDSDQKPFEVSFRNGKKHTVSQKVAKDILGATDRLKPEHRKNVHDEIHQSYDNLMSVHRLIAGR